MIITPMIKLGGTLDNVLDNITNDHLETFQICCQKKLVETLNTVLVRASWYGHIQFTDLRFIINCLEAEFEVQHNYAFFRIKMSPISTKNVRKHWFLYLEVFTVLSTNCFVVPSLMQGQISVHGKYQ
jgi:hypothetical protein